MFVWFENLLDAFPEKNPPKPPKGLLAFSMYHAKGSWKWLIIMAILSSLIASIEVSLFGFLGKFVDWLSYEDPKTFLKLHILKITFISSIIIFFLPILFSIHSTIIYQTLVGNLSMRVRWITHQYLLKQSLMFFQNESSGRLANKVMQTALAIREIIMKVLDVLNYAIIYFIGTLILAGNANWRFIFPFAIWIVVYIILLVIFIPKIRNTSEEQSNARSAVTGYIVDTYNNIMTVKLFSHTKREAFYAKKLFKNFQKKTNYQMRIASLFSFSIYFTNCLLLFSVSALGIFLWIHGIIMVGAVAIGIGLAIRLNGIAQWIMWEISNLFENIGIVEDGMASLTLPSTVQDKNKAKNLIVNKGEIIFDNVSFNYGKQMKIIKNLNLVICPGQKVGIIGRSGAGKSTLINLLLRFYDIQEGRICIDNQNIYNITQESLRANIGVVSQDTTLFQRTLKDNIIYGYPEASNKEIMEAIRDAEIQDFVKNIHDNIGNKGLNTLVGEYGVKLSGGQRQRIAISRVMLKNAPILLLDEATSALDSEAESAIQKNLINLMKGKTVLAIAHRLSTISAMDRLIVMEKGVIVEDGTHKKLLENNGLYSILWEKTYN